MKNPIITAIILTVVAAIACHAFSGWRCPLRYLPLTLPRLLLPVISSQF